MIDVTTAAGALKAKKHIRYQFDKAGVTYQRLLNGLRRSGINQVRLYNVLNDVQTYPSQSEYQDIITALAEIDSDHQMELTPKRAEHLKERVQKIEMPLKDFIFNEGFSTDFEKLILQKFSQKLPRFVSKRDMDHFLYLCRQKRVSEKVKITPDLIEQMQKEVRRTGVKIEDAYSKTGLSTHKPRTVAGWFKRPSKTHRPKEVIDALFNVYTEIPDRVIRFKIQCRMSDLNLVKDGVFKALTHKYTKLS